MISAKDDLLGSEEEESQSEDDEEGWMLTEEVEKDFYKTLSQIKNKDPTIYKKDVEFFKNIPAPDTKQKKPKKTNPLTLKEYERKLVLEHGGQLSDEDDTFESTPREPQKSYVEEQEALKKSLKAALDSGSSDDDGEEWGRLFKKREKTKEEKKNERETYTEWLQGEKETAGDAEAEKTMKPLHDFWTDPNLNEDDKFLRDYVVNKKFLELEEDKDGRPDLIEQSTDDEEGEDEDESKLPGHRFEEADQEFIKRYPRVMANSIRRKTDHRKLKREEVKERKIKEKKKKITQVKLKKKEKKREIEEKIEELKKLTGNEQLAFENVTKDDFDLDEHDRTMKRLFDEEFYAQEDPNFNPDYNNGGEEWNYEEDGIGEETNEEVCNDSEPAQDYYEPAHCEDPNFNMDCDYDPSLARAKEKKKESRSSRRKDKHRRTTLSEAVAKEKPRFDPTTHESFQSYVHQYYAIDCEDFIGDLPCRFKYRRTVPNSYGLTIEEILTADEKELERWCSIKRIHQLRPEHKERGDLKVYRRKAQDEVLKRKILPSLYKTVEEEEEEGPVVNDANKKEKKNGKNDANETNNVGDHDEGKIEVKDTVKKQKKKKKEKNHANETNNVKEHDSDKTDVMDADKKTKKKKKKEKKITSTEQPESTLRSTEGEHISKKRKREETKEIRKTKKNKTFHGDQRSFKNKKSKRENKSVKGTNKQIEDPILPGMSDARLLAYGIKPKKFKNKLKYKNDAA